MLIKADGFTIQPSRFVAGTKGSYGFEKLKIDFGEEWNGLGKKVVFYPPDSDPVAVVYGNEPIDIPTEVMQKRGVSRFAVVGYTDNKTLISLTGEITVLNALENTDNTTTPPTESEIAQVLLYMQTALDTADSVRTDADNGEFDGRDGNKWFFGTDVSGTGNGITAEVIGAAENDMYLNTSTFYVYVCAGTNCWNTIGNIKGATGSKGVKGDNGEKGDKGDKGDTGAKGDTGSRGPAGEQGIQGIQGAQGIQGVKGDTGEQGIRGEPGERGATGEAAGFGTPTATVTQLPSSSLPTVSVTASGDDTAKVFAFTFGIPSANIPKYSVRFSGSSPTGVREDNAVGMVANVAVGDETVINDFDSVPFFNRRICCCTWDAMARKWRVNAYRGETGFALDGSNGQVMYECIPFAISDNTDINSYISLCGSPCEGYTLAPMFKSWSEKIYLPCFNMSLDASGAPLSVSGKLPVYISLNNAMTKVRIFDTKAHGVTIEQYFTETCMQLVEFATKNLQSIMRGACCLSYNDKTLKIVDVESTTRFRLTAEQAAKLVPFQTISIGTSADSENISMGVKIESIIPDTNTAYSVITLSNPVQNLSAGNYLSSRMFETGMALKYVTNASSGSYSSNTDGKYPCVWRGKENPWAGCYDVICNLLVSKVSDNPASYTLNYLPDASLYSSGIITGDYIPLTQVIPTSSGYIKALAADSRYPFAIVPISTGASNSTYFSAYYYAPRNPVSTVRVGGYFAEYSACGIQFSMSSKPSDTWSVISFRLCINE